MNLRSELTWSPIEGKPTAAGVTNGTFTVHLDDTLIWGSPQFEWTWVEILEWLNQNWQIINIPTEDLPDDEETRYNHNFSVALQGALAPDLHVWRNQEEGFIKTDTVFASIPVEQWETFFATMGDKIAQRLTFSGDLRARLAIQEWLSR